MYGVCSNSWVRPVGGYATYISVGLADYMYRYLYFYRVSSDMYNWDSTNNQSSVNCKCWVNWFPYFSKH